MKIVSFQPDPAASEARAVGYLHDVSDEMPHRTVRPCVVICPGGGYVMLSDRETDPPATAFFAKGYQVFILYYSVGDSAKGMRPLLDAAKALLEIRRRSGEWNIDPEHVAFCGFSAGGHVAASLGTLWGSPELKKELGKSAGNCRPDALILGYPVISAEKFAHRDLRPRLRGNERRADPLLFTGEAGDRKDPAGVFVAHL